jgi:dethiobiotin synthetase
LAKKFDVEIILVSNLYLGSINHTLLTAHYLKSQELKVKGIVFNGPANPDSETIILKRTGLPCLLRVEQESKIDKDVVAKYATLLSEKLQ